MGLGQQLAEGLTEGIGILGYSMMTPQEREAYEQRKLEREKEANDQAYRNQQTGFEQQRIGLETERVANETASQKRLEDTATSTNRLNWRKYHLDERQQTEAEYHNRKTEDLTEEQRQNDKTLRAVEIEKARNGSGEETSLIKEYNVAVKQGYKGTLLDYQNSKAEAGQRPGIGEFATWHQAFKKTYGHDPAPDDILNFARSNAQASAEGKQGVTQVAKASTDLLKHTQSYNIMQKAAEQANAGINPGPNDMLLFSRHLEMTFGAVPGVRTGQDLIRHHLEARSLPQELAVQAQQILNGGQLHPDQRSAFLKLAAERLQTDEQLFNSSKKAWGVELPGDDTAVTSGVPKTTEPKQDNLKVGGTFNGKKILSIKKIK